MPAETVQLETVRLDLVAGAPGDLRDRLADPGIFRVGGAAASRADDVMVVVRGAPDIRVLPVREIDALEKPKLGHQLESAKERRPAESEATVPT